MSDRIVELLKKAFDMSIESSLSTASLWYDKTSKKWVVVRYDSGDESVFDDLDAALDLFEKLESE